MLTEKELHVLILRKQGLLQADIAKKLGITQGAVSRFEANARAKIAEAINDLALLDALGIDHDKKAVGVQERAAQLRRGRQ